MYWYNKLIISIYHALNSWLYANTVWTSGSMSSLVTTIRQQCSSPCSDILLQSTRLSVSSPNPAVVRRCTHRCRRDLCDARCSSDVSDDTLDAAAANLLASSPLKSCCCSGAVTTRDDSGRSSKKMFAKSFAGAGIGRILTRARLWPWNAISQHPETILLLILCREESTLIFYPLSQVADRSARIEGRLMESEQRMLPVWCGNTGTLI